MMVRLKLLLLSSLLLVSCATLHKHKSITRSSSDSSGSSRAAKDLQVHSVTTVKASRPIVVAADSLQAYGVFLPADTGIVHLIHITNGNITMDVMAQRQPSGAIKVDAAAATPKKTIMAPVDSTVTVDSTARRIENTTAAVHKETLTKDKQVVRSGVPAWVWWVGGIMALIGVFLFFYKRIKSKILI